MWKRIVSVITVVLVLGALVWFASGKWMEEFLDSAEARDIITSQYQGSIVEWMATGERFVARMAREGGIYEITIDRRSGSIEEIRRLEERSPDEAPKAEEEPSESDEPPLQLLSEEEAATAALEQVDGNVDDIDYEQEGDIPYYLVEIERSDDREATVQIHAINGEVMSVTWDD